MDNNEYLRNKFGFKGEGRYNIPNFGRNQIALLFTELGFKIGAEIGVEKGKYSKVLCKSNPGLHLFCVDKWESYGNYRDFLDQDELDGFYKEAQKRLAGYDCKFMRMFSVDAAKEFGDGLLDFVYIDANHSFYHVVSDIEAWLPKIRVGGIISGHDFKRPRNSITHVEQAVFGYTDSYNIDPWFVAGREEIVEGEIRDNARSWFWVKS